MTDIAKLKELRERVIAATGPDSELDTAIWLATAPGATRRKSTVKSANGLWPSYIIDETRDASHQLISVPRFAGPIDAALALVERMLPGWIWTVGSPLLGNPFMACLSQQASTRDVRSGYAASAPLAILAATLSALIAQAERAGE